MITLSDPYDGRPLHHRVLSFLRRTDHTPFFYVLRAGHIYARDMVLVSSLHAPMFDQLRKDNPALDLCASMMPVVFDKYVPATRMSTRWVWEAKQ